MRCPRWIAVIAIMAGLLWGFGPTLAMPLKRDPSNPRYFTDGTGKAIYLTGSYSHSDLVDAGNPTIIPFDYATYLTFLQSHNHNFIRLWTADYEEHVGPSFANPLPWLCVSGTPPTCSSYDLTQYDPSYFTRLRQRVIDAGTKGIYVSIMLFEGWSIQNWPGSQGWDFSPFKLSNNVNSINGDPNGDGYGLEIYAGTDANITTIQKNYVKKVIDTVNDLDNVLYEIVNEGQLGSVSWQYDMTNYVHSYEATLPKQHPVGMVTVANEAAVLGSFQQGSFAALANSPADWISPGQYSPEGYDWMNAPPAANGLKVWVIDSDHIWGAGGTVDWVWKSFARGLNPIYGDFGDLPITGDEHCCPMAGDPTESVRVAMGATLSYARKMDLAHMPPHAELCSSGYCLANPGQSYLAYLPSGGAITLNLSGGASSFNVEWFNPGANSTQSGSPVSAGSSQTLTAPFSGPAVLYLSSGPASDTAPPLPPTGLRVQ